MCGNLVPGPGRTLFPAVQPGSKHYRRNAAFMLEPWM
jgi:hypothetical protein